jgi:hypothetical protein
MEVSRSGAQEGASGVTWGARWRGMHSWGCIVFIILASVTLMSCSELSLGGTPTGHGTPGNVALAQLHWCGKVLMIFRNEGPALSTPAATSTLGTAGTPGTPGSTPTLSPTASATVTPSPISDWQQVKENLGFTPYLPAALPAGTCLVSAYGMVNDPIIGGSFTIGYLLPNHSPLSFSETLVSTQSQSTPFQCNVASSAQATPTPATGKGGKPVATTGTTPLPLQVCTGTRATTNIVFSARGTTAALQQFFNALQPDVTWIPATS